MSGIRFNKLLHRIKLRFNQYCNRRFTIKNQPEIACIRKACQITVEVFDRILHEDLHPGITEKKIARKIVQYSQELGADQDLAFPSIVGSGPNSSFVHSTPGKRRLKRGDVVQFDFGVKYKGYCSDFSRVVFMGSKKDCPKKIKKYLRWVRKNQKKSIKRIRKGMPFKIVAENARDYFKIRKIDHHYLHSLGHGVGLNIHEQPSISLGTSVTQTPRPGMVITVEPGLYFPGKFGFRVEDTVLVTEKGCEILTKYPKKIYESKLTKK